MKATFRQVYIYNLDVETGKKNAILPSLESLIAILERRRQAGQAHHTISKGSVDLAIGDIRIDPTNQLATILIRYSDKDAAESAYSNISGGTFTAHRKGANEGGETGAHLFLSTAPERTMPNRYTCALEKTPNIDANLISRFVNKIIHDEYDADAQSFTFPNLAGQRTRAGDIALDRCLPRIELEGQPSETLERDVEEGRLTGITLSRAIAKTPMGGVPFLLKREASLKVEVDQDSLTGSIWQDVRRALRTESDQYQTANIGIRLPGRKKTVSVKVATATAAPLTELYVKSFDVWNINPAMAQSSETIALQLESRVMTLVKDERDV